MAKPRVFVSSTYYDLKYVRERLNRFLLSYNMEPVLFEYDKVYYNPSGNPTSSCYKEIEGCHLMILIIGGRYGSLDKENEREAYENEYVSVTQNEYKTAIEKGVPTMVFIDRNVYTEYKTYQNNKAKIPADFKFAYVDDVKIFEFINKVSKGAVKDFDRVEDIEHYFAHQISGMLCDYLVGLQVHKDDEEIKTAVDEIKTISSSMQSMINTIAERVLGAQDEKYKEALFEQQKSVVDLFLDLLKQNVLWGTGDFNVPEAKILEIKNILLSTIFNKKRIDKILKQDIYTQFDSLDELKLECQNRLNKAYKGANVVIRLYQFSNQLFKILENTANDARLKQYMYDRLTKTIVDIIQPF